MTETPNWMQLAKLLSYNDEILLVGIFFNGAKSYIEFFKKAPFGGEIIL